MNSQTLEWLLSPAALALFGLCIGSFLNVVVHRLPVMMERQWRQDSAEMLGIDPVPPAPGDDGRPLGLARPRSRCPKCGHVLRWHENIPLLGWLRLGGRCSACRTPISPRYPLVELGCALLFAAIGWRFGAEPQTLLWCGFAATLLAASLIDWDTTLLPDSMTQPLAWAGLLGALLGWLPLSPEQALWGAVGGYMSLWSISQLFRLVTGREGMGAGDFKLLAALGAWLGWQALPIVLLLSSLAGAIIGIGLILLRNHHQGKPIPFGPYLAIAGWITLLWGDSITRWYLDVVL